MGIPITGLFEPSGGAGSFDLYSPADIEAGNINVILQAIAGGAFKGGSHATAPAGEVVIQVKTTTGAPAHSASLGTPCWNSVDLLLYVNNNGSTGWTLVGAGGGDVATDAIWDSLGDLVYGTGADTGARLAGNITTTRKLLTQIGDGAASAAPAWDVLIDADIPAAIARDAEVATAVSDHAAIAAAHHALVSIGADAAHSLAAQVLSAVAAGAAQVGHISLAAQTLGAGVKTFTSIPVLPASDPTTDNQAARKAYVDLMILKSLLTTRGDMIRRGVSAPERFAKGTAGKLLKMGANDPDWSWDTGAIEFVIDGGGDAIPAGIAGTLEVPFACFITGWTITGDASGSIVVTVKKATYANYPGTMTTISGTEKPTLSSAQKNQDLSLTTWTQPLALGDIVEFTVDALATTVTRVTVSLRVDKYRTS